MKRSLLVYAVENYTIKPGKSKDIVLELKEIPFEVHGYKDFPKDGVATVAKLKSAKENQMVQTLILHLGENGKTTVQLTNYSSENWKIHEGEMVGCLDMRSSGYFHVSRETLQQIMKSSFKDNCSLLSERETQEYFDLYHQVHKEAMNYVNSQVNQRLKQQQGNTQLVGRNKPITLLPNTIYSIINSMVFGVGIHVNKPFRIYMVIFYEINITELKQLLFT